VITPGRRCQRSFACLVSTAPLCSSWPVMSKSRKEPVWVPDAISPLFKSDVVTAFKGLHLGPRRPELAGKQMTSAKYLVVVSLMCAVAAFPPGFTAVLAGAPSSAAGDERLRALAPFLD